MAARRAAASTEPVHDATAYARRGVPLAPGWHTHIAPHPAPNVGVSCHGVDDQLWWLILVLVSSAHPAVAGLTDISRWTATSLSMPFTCTIAEVASRPRMSSATDG